MPPRVSVCVRAFSRPDALRVAVGGALSQTFRDIEVVVSDDGGRMEQVVAAFADPRLRYHANPAPAGAVANLKHAFGLADGDLLALLDDDDRWRPEFLARAVEQFDRDPELGVVFSDYCFRAAGREIRRPRPFDAGRHDSFVPALLDHSIPPSAAVIRRQVWEQGESDVPLEPGLAGSVTMWLRAAAQGWPFYFVDEPLVEYGLHSDQMSWSDGAQPLRWAATLERFRFDDAASERMRRSRLAEARMVEANQLLRGGRLRDAQRAVHRARAVSPSGLGLRELLAITGVRSPVARFLSRHPRLLAAGLPLWRRMRPSPH